ncbi:hypothetical protein RHMOL_Rhmol09G0109900 [Rhododendron molle]|uniref:Uncharacterized protein n=1 Tax=Rhododendron molle TaxID=49168 RepID=A0ACC0MDS7_RHOML|nr:hypothetical protein RHMOL_Rhmol09G0109900 [Rhododendron molle]
MAEISGGSSGNGGDDANSGLVVTGLGLAGAGTSGGDSGDDGGDQTGVPPRDSASRKASMVEDEPQRVSHTERVEFVLPVGSLSHEPTVRSDLAEFVGAAFLGRLMQDSPEVVEVVMAARAARSREISQSDEEERLIREAEARAREAEPAERAQEEGPWTHEVAVTLANSLRELSRHEFVAETYTPPDPHVFIIRAEGYRSLQKEYDEEEVLRDREQHLSRGWARV